MQGPELQESYKRQNLECSSFMHYADLNIDRKMSSCLPACYLIRHYSDFPPQYPMSPPIKFK